jgi:bifunctional DNA-binding transcriptional regulator/antitoxin component of YhaV-PrlF toxin-antitoxin module
VTIPLEIRERFGFLPGTEVEWVVEQDDVRLVRSRGAPQSRGERSVALLRGRAKAGLGTDAILALTRAPGDHDSCR